MISNQKDHVGARVSVLIVVILALSVLTVLGQSNAAAVNGPFIVRALPEPIVYGWAGEFLAAPIIIHVEDEQGGVPVDVEGNPVALAIEFSIFSAPDGSGIMYFDEGAPLQYEHLDESGRAQVGFHVGDLPGVYVVQVTLPGYEDCVDAFVEIYTGQAVSDIHIEFDERRQVGESFYAYARITDWCGNPVDSATPILTVWDGERPHQISPIEVLPPFYTFEVYTERAGPNRLTIGDAQHGYWIERTIGVSSGTVEELEFLPYESPLASPPHNETVIELRAWDTYGNLVKLDRLEWVVDGGELSPVDPSPEASAAWRLAIYGRAAAITVYGEDFAIDLEVEQPEVHLRETSDDLFVRTDDEFGFFVEIQPLEIEAGIQEVMIDLAYSTESVEFVELIEPSFRTHGGWVTAEPYDGGIFLHFTVNAPITGRCRTRIVLGELRFRCINELEAQFEVMMAELVAVDPPVTYQLNKGLKFCKAQKKQRQKKLCINFCIVDKPGGMTYSQLETRAKQHVSHAQGVFNDNIPVCCPDILLNVCYTQILWKDYKAIVNGGDKGGVLEDGIWSTYSSDAAKDAWGMSNEMKNLFKKCRKSNCISVYLVPEFVWKDGTWSTGYGVAISPNDFPVTTAASGPGIILDDDLVPNQGSLVHELGHILIDLPRNTGGGSEHVSDSNRVMYGNETATGRNTFSKEECSRIWDNIDQYLGNCK